MEVFTSFAALEKDVFEQVSSVCIGTGRFLRAVLVPALVELGGEVVLAQTRGTSFGQHMSKRPDRKYEVDTVLKDGKVITSSFPVAAVGTLGTADGRKCFMKLAAQLPNLRYIGLGLTEAGIAHNGQSILDLAEFLHACFQAKLKKLSIINTDNMPWNGDAISKHVHSCDFTQNAVQRDAFIQWLHDCVFFHNSMVDRITSHRDGDTDVPRAEPLPAKALVIEDLAEVLPHQFGSVPGVVVRTQSKQLEVDIALKLRIANGIHTAMVYAMALGRLYHTDACIGHPDILPYLEQLFERDIVHACAELSIPRLQVTPVFSEWMDRLQHPFFGLSCFFVCQNATQKMGIRLLPSIEATLAAGETPSDFMVFALAVTLRFLTPIGDQPHLSSHPPVFVGRLDADSSGQVAKQEWEYVPGLAVNPEHGTYAFRDGDGIVPLLLRPLGRPGGCSAAATASLASEVLSRLERFNPRTVVAHAELANRVGHLLHRMLNGECAMAVLSGLKPQQPLHLHPRLLNEAVRQEVDAAEAIDIHTHLFSAGFGSDLMQFGIDAMLTVHNIVSEYLATSEEEAESFYELPTKTQAEHVWEGLFIKASPISEQCRGVITTLSALGLHEELASRDLEAIRRWYKGQDVVMFNEKMMRLARLRYVITSCDPFSPVEVSSCLDPPEELPRYRSAVSLDKLLEGDWSTVCQALKAAGQPLTLRGVEMLLQRVVVATKPVFFTVATTHNFQYSSQDLADEGIVEMDAEILQTRLPSAQQVLDKVVLPICKSAGLPCSLRMGTKRGVRPALRLAGDGVGSAQLDSLANLCLGNPKIKFMATVLSRNDQHEVAVLANKFRNLHIWGCWWFCNNPSVVAEVTALRMELLGTGFTFQASSARVHDQLIFKWIHARALLARFLQSKYEELMASGWKVSRGDVRRDVHRLLGGAYEEFIAKKL